MSAPLAQRFLGVGDKVCSGPAVQEVNGFGELVREDLGAWGSSPSAGDPSMSVDRREEPAVACDVQKGNVDMVEAPAPAIPSVGPGAGGRHTPDV